MTCVKCDYSGNESPCPACGAPCIFDEYPGFQNVEVNDANETVEEDEENGEEDS